MVTCREFAAVAMWALPALVSAQNPMANDPGAVAGGRNVFRIYCSPCHGIHGQGGRGPDLTRGVYANGETDADLFRVISNGVPGTEMAGFAGGDINEEDTWRVVSFLRSIARHDAGAAPGNAASGEKVFWGKAACGTCHMVGGKGGAIGPNLSRIGRERSLEFLREKITDPNKDVANGYATITVVKRDGAKLTGVERGWDDFSVQFVDSTQNYFSFLRSDLASVERDSRSMMPANYGHSLAPAELDDLVSYLMTLRGAEGKQ